MKRKLIQLSPSTSVVSVPKSWAVKNKLVKGTELSVLEVENKLVISTESTKTESEILIDISKLSEDLIWAYIDASYVAGYDSIRVKTKNKEQTTLVGETVKYFPGLLLFDETNTSAHLKDITGETKEDVNKILNRIFNMIISLLEGSIIATKEKDWNFLAQAKEKDHIINSYCSYCFRQLNRFGFTQLSKIGLLHTLIKLIEIYSDKIVKVLIESGKKKKTINEAILKDILASCKIIQRLHTKYDQEKLLTLDNLRIKLEKASEKNTIIQNIAKALFDIEELEIQLHL